MALFNFISIVSTEKVYINNQMPNIVVSPNYDHVDLQDRCLYPKMQTILSIKNSQKSSYSNQQLLIAAESIYRFSKSYKYTPRLFRSLINKYWQQTIFLSISNPLSKEYISQINKQGLSSNMHLKKKLLITFSNALMHGGIDSNIKYTPNSISALPFTYIKYTWKKGLNIELLNKVLFTLTKSDHKYFPSNKQKDLIRKLKNNNIPLFVITNCFGQLIIAEPSGKILSPRSLPNSIFQWYLDRLPNLQYNQGIYESWFFVNPNDANEYRHYISSMYNRSSLIHNLSTTTSSIDFYYRLNRNTLSRMEFRLFPDLQEVGRLVKDSQFRKNIIFDKRQDYGKSYFQGQPIYFIEPIMCTKNNSLEKSLVNYYYNLEHNVNQKKYNVVFLSKETALKGWQYFRQQMQEYKLPVKPVLRVYNLEDFLKDMENSPQTEDILVIPSLESYEYIKKQYIYQEEKTSLNMLIRNMNFYKSMAQLWCHRIILSLTSRQPPSW